MTALIEMKPGDHAVIDRTYRFVVVKVTKVTAMQFKASGEWSARESTYQRRAALFSGPEDAAKSLAENLTSSLALFEDEKRKAGERRDKRNADLIAAAGAAPTPSPIALHSS